MSTHPIGNTSLTTIAVPIEIKRRAQAHGLNVSHVCREAIRLKVELMDRAVKLDRMRGKKVKNYSATLEPFDSLDGVIDTSCDDIVEADK